MLKTLVCVALLIVAALVLFFTKPSLFLFELMRKSLGTGGEEKGKDRDQGGRPPAKKDSIARHANRCGR